MKIFIQTATALALTMAVPALAREAPEPEWRTPGAFAALRVSDARAMSKWYADMLGFRLVTFDEGRKSALLERHGSVLELIQRSDGEAGANPAQDTKTPGIIKIGFVVDDFDRLQAWLAARKLPVLGRVIVSDVDRLRTLAISDPEGNMIQFFGR
jgi:catechol-2,3-dioxygenase